MDYKEISIKIKERRNQLGLRQEDVTEMSGVSSRTIYNIEEGKGNPSLKTLQRICDILGLEIIVGIKKTD